MAETVWIFRQIELIAETVVPLVILVKSVLMDNANYLAREALITAAETV